MKKMIAIAGLTGCMLLAGACSKSKDNRPPQEDSSVQTQHNAGEEENTAQNGELVDGLEKNDKKDEDKDNKNMTKKDQASNMEKLPKADLKTLSKLPDKVYSWGQGTNMDDQNRPISAVEYQGLYGKYDADFVKETEDKNIYLTFDEGYENGYTSKILDGLKAAECPAVFFVTMDYVKKEPTLVERMIQEGHVVGAHSVTHPSAGIPSLSLEEQEQEIVQLHEYVQEKFNYSMYLFRFPAGIYSEQSLALLQQLGYRSVFWSFAYADWDPDNQMEKSAALKKVKDRIHNGAIYLLHAVSATNAAILEDFVASAREEGYHFVKYEK